MPKLSLSPASTTRVSILRRLRPQKRLRSKPPDIIRRDEPKLVPAGQIIPQDPRKHGALKPRLHILEEASRLEDRIRHALLRLRLRLAQRLALALALALPSARFRVRLDSSLGLELRDADPALRQPRRGRVHKVPRAVRERGVDERFALLLLGGLRLADAELDAVDAPQGFGDGEDGGGVAEVAGDEVDGGGFGG